MTDVSKFILKFFKKPTQLKVTEFLLKKLFSLSLCKELAGGLI